MKVRLSDGSYAEIPQDLKDIADYFGIDVKEAQPIAQVRHKVEQAYDKRRGALYGRSGGKARTKRKRKKRPHIRTRTVRRPVRRTRKKRRVT